MKEGQINSLGRLELSKPEKMLKLIDQLQESKSNPDSKDSKDIISQMLNLIGGGDKKKSEQVDADGNPLKTRKDGARGIDNDDKMMMMALALIFGAMAIAVTGGAAGAAIMGAAPAIGVVPDLMKMGKDFLGKSEKDLNEQDSKILGKSLLAFLLADKVKDNIKNFGDHLLSGNDIFTQSIGKYIESLRGMGDDDKKREIDTLKTMVKGNVYLLEGKGVDKSDAKTGPNPSEADQKFEAIFAQFEAMIAKPKEDLKESKLLSSLSEIQVGKAIVRIETITKKDESRDGENANLAGGDVPSTSSSARSGDAPRAVKATSLGRAPAPAAANVGR